MPSTTIMVMARHLVVALTFASPTVATPTPIPKLTWATLTENQLGMAPTAQKPGVSWPARTTSDVMNTKYSIKLDGT